MVELRDIPGFEGAYAASSDGRIWSHPKRSNHNRNGRWLKGRITQDGYLRAALYTPDGVRCDVLVHRLIVLAWIGLAPAGCTEINHRDGIKTNNQPANLEWCTRSENQQHAWATGLKQVTPAQVAAGKSRRRLSFETAQIIRARVIAGERQIEVAASLGVTKNIVSNIVRGRKYLEE